MTNNIRPQLPQSLTPTHPHGVQTPKQNEIPSVRCVPIGYCADLVPAHIYLACAILVYMKVEGRKLFLLFSYECLGTHSINEGTTTQVMKREVEYQNT